MIKETSTYHCENCGIAVDNPNFNFNLTTKLEDCTGSAYAWFLGIQATNIMSPITPKQFQIAWVSSQNDDKELKDLIHSRLYTPHNLMIVAKQSTYAQNTRIDYVVQNINPINYKEANKGLIEMLKVYSTKEDLMHD